MKTLKINTEKLTEVTTEAVKDMLNFDWEGWKIDILIDNNGEIWGSHKNVNAVYPSPQTDCLFSVYPVKFDPDESKFADEEDIIYNTTNELIEAFTTGEIGNLFDIQETKNVEFE